MSRYRFVANNLRFCTGWDPPIGGFFLDIWQNIDDETPLWDNLARPDPRMTIDDIKTVCRDYGAILPPEIEGKLLNDEKLFRDKPLSSGAKAAMKKIWPEMNT